MLRVRRRVTRTLAQTEVSSLLVRSLSLCGSNSSRPRRLAVNTSLTDSCRIVFSSFVKVGVAWRGGTRRANSEAKRQKNRLHSGSASSRSDLLEAATCTNIGSYPNGTNFGAGK